MVTRTKLLFVADIHTNACTYIIYNEQNYKCRTQFLWFSLSSLFIQTIYKLAYVYSQLWYCADSSYAFLSMCGVRSRKYCASISDMTTTWGLRREVVLSINLPRASIEAWRMLRHLSSHGSRGWWRYWGAGLCLQRGQFSSYHKSGNKIWQLKQWYILNCNNIIAYHCHMWSVLSC